MGKRLRSLVRATAALVVSAGAAASPVRWSPVAAAQPDPLPAGARLYLEGRTARGSVNAVVQQDVRVRSTDLPCANCHRRSGWGAAEGALVVPPVIGSVLFAPVTRGAAQMGTLRTTGAGTRPAYTRETLLRAVRDGVAPDGRTLSGAMPRYEIGTADADALAAYLRDMAAHAPPGVTPSTIRLATIAAADVPAPRRASLLDVLRTFVRYKNGGARHETRRRERGPWDMAQEYANYRDWVLDEWTLTGPPSGWTAQLEALYAAHPVFAIVGGVADADWTPVHQFAERHGVPVVLPDTALPPAHAADSFYSMYFSRGLLLEARAVAARLDRDGAGPVAQLSRCGSRGDVAAAALAQARHGSVTRSRCAPAGAVLAGSDWRALVGDHPGVVVAWLDLSDLSVLASGGDGLAPDRDIYISSTILQGDVLRVPGAIASRAILVEPYVPLDDLERHATRALTWMKANAITPADRRVAIDALFAATLASDALSMPHTLSSREYFVERVEHMAARTPNRSAYRSVRLDAGQRVGSLGCALLRLPLAPGGPFRKVEEWFVPRP